MYLKKIRLAENSHFTCSVTCYLKSAIMVNARNKKIAE